MQSISPLTKSYLIEGSEKSGLSHTGPEIAKEILKVFYFVYLWDLDSNITTGYG